MALVLGPNGGGAIVIMLSVTSFYTNPLDASYGASKAAEWSWTDSIRVELAHQGPLVGAEHASFIDTDMAAGIDRQDQPRVGRHQAFDPVEAGPRRGPRRRTLPGLSRPRYVAITNSSFLIYQEVQAFRDSLTRGSR